MRTHLVELSQAVRFALLLKHEGTWVVPRRLAVDVIDEVRHPRVRHCHLPPLGERHVGRVEHASGRNPRALCCSRRSVCAWIQPRRHTLFLVDEVGLAIGCDLHQPAGGQRDL